MNVRLCDGDITRLQVDAIVNAANSSLLGGGGVDGAIHRAAGPELAQYCRTLGGCKTGEAKITPGFRLPARHVIHTVGPVWRGGDQGEAELLRACYRNSLALAAGHAEIRSLAFPAVSCGIYGYPKAQACALVWQTLSSWPRDGNLDWVLLVCPDAGIREEYRRLGVREDQARR